MSISLDQGFGSLEFLKTFPWSIKPFLIQNPILQSVVDKFPNC